MLDMGARSSKPKPRPGPAVTGYTRPGSVRVSPKKSTSQTSFENGVRPILQPHAHHVHLGICTAPFSLFLQRSPFLLLGSLASILYHSKCIGVDSAPLPQTWAFCFSLRQPKPMAVGQGTERKASPIDSDDVIISLRNTRRGSASDLSKQFDRGLGVSNATVEYKAAVKADTDVLKAAHQRDEKTADVVRKAEQIQSEAEQAMVGRAVPCTASLLC